MKPVPLMSIIYAALWLLSCPDAVAGDFTARGNEPGWHIEVGEEGITFRTTEGETLTVVPRPAPKITETYQAEVEGEPFSLIVADTLCVDTMSGMPHPKTVTVSHGERKFSGCGGDPASLLHGEWAIAEIDGKSIVSGSTPTLAFDKDGRISGSGSCNRYFGGFKLSGEGLAFSELGSSQMMCEQPLMDQELVFLQILGAADRFDIDAEGRLVLHGSDGRTVVGRKA